MTYFMKKVYQIIKKIIYCFLFLYAINVVVSPLGVVIPINYISLLIIYCFDLSGLIMLVLFTLYLF